jgi:hypothetical protein
MRIRDEFSVHTILSKSKIPLNSSPFVDDLESQAQSRSNTEMIKTIEMTEAIVEAKFAKGASWADISKGAGMSEVFVVSACLGQNTLPVNFRDLHVWLLRIV